MAEGMMARDFSRQLMKAGIQTHERLDMLMERLMDQTYRSVKYGSSRTGAPGQPVKDGHLIASVEGVMTSKDGFEVTAGNQKVDYAAIIEYNTRNATLRSKVGGFHSFAITSLNFRWLVRHEAEAISRMPLNL